VPEIIAMWTEVAAAFERVVGRARVWSALIDVTSHEHDIRAAVGRPGARDSEAVWHTGQELLRWLRPPVPLQVAVEDAEFNLGPGGEALLGLTTTRFEALRWRMGRRSQAQLAVLDWSGDPAPVIDHLAIFGPAERDILE
jgi:hypothetical protein